MTKSCHPLFFALALSIIFVSGMIPVKAATPLFSTIVTNGPATNRVNLVIFSEGYTSAQLGQFLTDATNTANFFLSAQPYAEYSNYFNVFAIATNSAHSGSTHLIYTSYTNGYTYFNSSYDNVQDYIITIPPNPSDSTNSHGQGKINSLLQLFLPSTNNDLPVLLVNDPTPGGSDNYGTTAIASVNDASGEILLHESGHTLGNLGDEYTTPYPGYPNTEEPNTTTQTDLSLIKWNAWIPNGTPIPTPPTEAYQNTVGLFQGAHYHTNGWYRPTLDSRMQSLQSSSGFGPVNQEALVLAIYEKMRPIDSHSPTTNNLSVASPQILNFGLNLLAPATHALNVQWRTNGMAVTGATNSVFNISSVQLGNGTNKVEADVWDATTFVRTDLKNLLKQTNTWSLTVNVPTMQIDSLKWQTNGSFAFRVTGNSPNGVSVQASTDLLQWIALQTNSLTNGQFLFTNAQAILFQQHFYRTVTPP
jgi:IgA Peptidase M64